MSRSEKINKIKSFAPKILNISISELGYEFDAIHENGLILGFPGMLLGISSGNLTENNLKNPSLLLNKLINSVPECLLKFSVVSDEILDDFFNAIQN